MTSILVNKDSPMTARLDGRPLEHASDAGLIGASLRNPEAFAGLYDRHARRLYVFAYRRAGADATDDIVAETFLVA